MESALTALLTLLELRVVPAELDVQQLSRSRLVAWEHDELEGRDSPACARLERSGPRRHRHDRHDMTRPLSAVRISTPDGSWAEIILDEPGAPPGEGEHAVTEGGPRALRRLVEDAYQLWGCHGQPGWV